MRIAQVAPLYESVPPKMYGGTERVVSYITEELVRRGHDVTLFASADSTTQARLVACSPMGIRMDGTVRDGLALHIAMIERVAQETCDFDLVHYHVDYLHFPLSRRSVTPHVTTLHGRLDLPELVPLYREFRNMPLIAISNAQRGPLAWANWRATVHHGLPLDAVSPGEGNGGYLLFLGRISPEKRADRAITIAQSAGWPLKIVAKVDPADEAYFASTIRPLLSKPGVEFLGELGGEDKIEILRGAAALLFPIDWPEPFGMVLIEAMAAGTPVIAFPRGSVPEVIDHGLSGLIVHDVGEAVRAVPRAAAMDRGSVRYTFEQRFSVGRMVDDYLTVYASLLEGAAPDSIERLDLEYASQHVTRTRETHRVSLDTVRPLFP
ncbi:MAG: glycosyltransferase family 4 protein [Actinobacteria bacterium]|nr:glycosyltransferase family 4 protein [Actinomycetota bacterium]